VSAGRADIWLLFTTRTARLFAYGALSLILVLYLKDVGLGDRAIGLLLAVTLAGDTVLSLWITTVADRIGRKRMLLAGAGLMVLGGAVFALTGNFVALFLAATIGVLSPSGNEVGPFLAIEQAALAQLVADEKRTRTFAWYQLAGALATAAGALICGELVQALQGRGVESIQSYRVVLFGYAGIGFLLAVVFTLLSSAVEVRSSSPGEVPPPRALFGLHRSRSVVLRLSALFALDAFAGAFVLQALIASWFHDRFDADPDVLGRIFFGGNVLAGFSGLAAAAIARWIGLLNTMVFTHVPSNVLLILVPFMPTLEWAVAVLWLRFAISQMDVPTRQSYTAAVVAPDERSAAAGVANVARTSGAAVAPAVQGFLSANLLLLGVPFVVAGSLKLLYDALLFRMFRSVKPPEESGSR
jgi:MFS family permease